MSSTVIICVAVFVYPISSITVHVTVVFPIGKTDGALFVTVPTPQFSAKVALPKTTPVAEQLPKSADTVMAVGAVIEIVKF